MPWNRRLILALVALITFSGVPGPDIAISRSDKSPDHERLMRELCRLVQQNVSAPVLSESQTPALHAVRRRCGANWPHADRFPDGLRFAGEQQNSRPIVSCGNRQGDNAPPVCFTGTSDVDPSVETGGSEEHQKRLREDLGRRAEELRSRMKTQAANPSHD
jgi:hypothetical protein